MFEITEEQAVFLDGKDINTAGWTYKPVQDANGKWFISEQEVDNSNIEWVQNLTLSDSYVAPERILPENQ